MKVLEAAFLRHCCLNSVSCPGCRGQLWSWTTLFGPGSPTAEISGSFFRQKMSSSVEEYPHELVTVTVNRCFELSGLSHR